MDYVIDGMNRRVGRKVGGTLVQGLLYENQLNAVAELDGSGNLVAQYTYGTKANVPDVKINGTGSYRILSDHLGSPRLVVNTADGTVAERMDFDEWGNVKADSAPATTLFGFAGGLYEKSSALVRFGARDYSPVEGRWTSKDPIRFRGGQANIYQYIGDDPINGADPTGLDPYGPGGPGDENMCPTYSPADRCNLKCFLAAGVCHFVLKRNKEFRGVLYSNCVEACPKDPGPPN